MRALHELQRSCLDSFLLNQACGLSRQLVDGRIPANVQIEIYRNNARKICRQALASTYPVVERLVGEACFAGLADVYRHESPSSSGDLLYFARGFPKLLERLYGAGAHAYLADIARLELACDEVLAEPAVPGISPRLLVELGSVDPANISLEINPFARFLASEFPVLTIWRRHGSGDATPVDLESGAEHVAVLRREDGALLAPLSGSQFSLAVSLQRGLSLEAAFDGLVRAGSDADFADALQVLLARGLITDITFQQPGGNDR